MARASYRCAWVIADMHEEKKGKSDTRLLDWLIPDHLVTAGESIRHREAGLGRREHVVPRRVILEHCQAMVDREPLKAIADLIARSTRIVRITVAEQVLLDSRDGRNLRQKMLTEDWLAGGDHLYARLANIDWERWPAYHDLDAPDPPLQDT